MRQETALRVAVEHSPGAVAALRDEWIRLVEASDEATIYQTWQWNSAWWDAYRRRKRLWLVTVRDDADRLVGIGPFYSSYHFGTPMRRLSFLGTGASDYMDLIALPGHSATVCQAILQHLSGVRGYDMADLQHLRPGSALRGYLETPGQPMPRHYQVHNQEPCPFAALPSDFDELAQSLGKKMRSNISYYTRLLTRTFEDGTIEQATGQGIAPAMADLYDLHQKRWRSRRMPGVMGEARIRDFHSRIAGSFAAEGWLRLFVIRAQGRTLAGLYCYRFRERFYYYLGGFDPELGKMSLGTVLTAHAIRAAIDEGCTEFDFLRGDESYKTRWCSGQRMNQRLLVLRPGSLRGHALARLNRVEHAIEVRAKEFADGYGRGKRK